MYGGLAVKSSVARQARHRKSLFCPRRPVPRDVPGVVKNTSSNTTAGRWMFAQARVDLFGEATTPR